MTEAPVTEASGTRASTAESAFPRRNPVMDLVRLIRPLDWSKNSFVFAGLLFGHRWNEPPLVFNVLQVFGAFCAVASSIYIFNDFLDRERDAHHPKKRHRPLASGAVSVPSALALATVLMVVGLASAFWVGQAAGALLAVYGTLNVGYSLRLKHVVVLDIFIIAAGFVIRILVGTLGVDIKPSPWVLLCGFTLALFLGACKRRAELAAVGLDSAKHRSVLEAYNPHVLDHIIGITAACSILAYSLYTIDAKTRATHGTEYLIATIPFVIYGILRYVYRLHSGFGGAPARDLIRDPHLLLTVAGWVAVTLALVA